MTDTTDFLAGPRTFLYDHPCTVEGNQQFEPYLTHHAAQQVYELRPASGAYFAGITVRPYAGTLKQIQVTPSAVPADGHYLPFKGSQGVFMELSNNADVFVTGPLSGCHIYMAKNGVTPVVFHINANEQNQSRDQNMAVKRNKFINTCGFLGFSVVGAGKLERDDYMKDTNGGLVFGERRGVNQWKFWFQGLSATGGKGNFFPIHFN